MSCSPSCIRIGLGPIGATGPQGAPGYTRQFSSNVQFVVNDQIVPLIFTGPFPQFTFLTGWILDSSSNPSAPPIVWDSINQEFEVQQSGAYLIQYEANLTGLAGNVALCQCFLTKNGDTNVLPNSATASPLPVNFPTSIPGLTLQLLLVGDTLKFGAKGQLLLNGPFAAFVPGPQGQTARISFTVID